MEKVSIGLTDVLGLYTAFIAAVSFYSCQLSHTGVLTTTPFEMCLFAAWNVLPC